MFIIAFSVSVNKKKMKKVISADLVDESINDHFKELLSDFLGGNVSVRGVFVHPDFGSFVGKSLGGKLGEDSALGLVWSMLVLDRKGFSCLCRFLEKNGDEFIRQECFLYLGSSIESLLVDLFVLPFSGVARIGRVLNHYRKLFFHLKPVGPSISSLPGRSKILVGTSLPVGFVGLGTIRGFKKRYKNIVIRRIRCL